MEYHTGCEFAWTLRVEYGVMIIPVDLPGYRSHARQADERSRMSSGQGLTIVAEIASLAMTFRGLSYLRSSKGPEKDGPWASPPAADIIR
jgi:hypothetical protein